jgi:hypothetical protein
MLEDTRRQVLVGLMLLTRRSVHELEKQVCTSAHVSQYRMKRGYLPSIRHMVIV